MLIVERRIVIQRLNILSENILFIIIAKHLLLSSLRVAVITFYNNSYTIRKWIEKTFEDKTKGSKQQKWCMQTIRSVKFWVVYSICLLRLDIWRAVNWFDWNALDHIRRIVTHETQIKCRVFKQRIIIIISFKCDIWRMTSFTQNGTQNNNGTAFILVKRLLCVWQHCYGFWSIK